MGGCISHERLKSDSATNIIISDSATNMSISDSANVTLARQGYGVASRAHIRDRQWG